MGQVENAHEDHHGYLPARRWKDLCGWKCSSSFKTCCCTCFCIYIGTTRAMHFPNMTMKKISRWDSRKKQSELRFRLRRIMEHIGLEYGPEAKSDYTFHCRTNACRDITWPSKEAKILILDEPTSAPTFDEVESFFKVVQTYGKRGLGLFT